MTCPRRCGVDRTRGEYGACGVPATPRLARAALHLWEEPSISGERGSGTVFFSGCSLGCVFCQNHAISGGQGIDITEERLVEIFLELQQAGVHNINLVTPTQYAPMLCEVIPAARARGLTLPIVYNSGGYELPEVLHRLSGLVDIYLPDFKYASSELAARYAGAPDYPEVAKAALAEMIDQCPAPIFDEDGMMRRGVLVRHLMLPSAYRNSHEVIKYLATLSSHIYVSIMNQYTPPAGISERFPELGKPVSDHEYRRLVAYAVRLGITAAYVQEGGTVSESFIPSFCGEGVLKKAQG